MTEPIDQATKDLIEKESVAYRIGEFIDYGDQNENAENQIELAYIAGATAWAEKLRQLETQSHDQVRIIEHLEEKLKRERNKAIDECIILMKKKIGMWNLDSKHIADELESLKTP